MCSKCSFLRRKLNNSFWWLHGFAPTIVILNPIFVFRILIWKITWLIWWIRSEETRTICHVCSRLKMLVLPIRSTEITELRDIKKAERISHSKKWGIFQNKILGSNLLSLWSAVTRKLTTILIIIKVSPVLLLTVVKLSHKTWHHQC